MSAQFKINHGNKNKPFQPIHSSDDGDGISSKEVKEKEERITPEHAARLIHPDTISLMQRLRQIAELKGFPCTISPDELKVI